MWCKSHNQGFATSMSISKDISSSIQSFCIWIFFFLTRQFYFFSLVFFVTFSSFDFLWHATDHWHSNVNKNVRNTLHCICFARNEKKQMLDDTWLKYIQHENLVGWTRKCWTKSLIKNKLYPTSSNTIFVFFFSIFINFVSSQMYSTFRPTSKIYDLGWNAGCTCFGL